MSLAAEPISFRFLDPGPLIDHDLELVAPDIRWIDDHLHACHDPLTRAQMPLHADATRDTFLQFLRAHPNGHQTGNAAHDIVPAYHFWMRLRPEYHTLLPIAGAIGLRLGHTPTVDLYFGHLGYHVYPAARGHHYAERACRLLLPLARAHGLCTLVITCNPDNPASRRTCERLGGQLINIIALPPDNVLYQQGDRTKCRYQIPL